MKSRFVLGAVFICVGALVVSHVLFAYTGLCDEKNLQPIMSSQKGKIISDVQKCLFDAGVLSEKAITGMYGAETISAIKTIYAQAGLKSENGKRLGPVGIAQLKKNIAQKKNLLNTTPQTAASSSGASQGVLNNIFKFTGLFLQRLFGTDTQNQRAPLVPQDRFSYLYRLSSGESQISQNEAQEIFEHAKQYLAVDQYIGYQEKNIVSFSGVLKAPDELKKQSAIFSQDIPLSFSSHDFLAVKFSRSSENSHMYIQHTKDDGYPGIYNRISKLLSGTSTLYIMNARTDPIIYINLNIPALFSKDQQKTYYEFKGKDAITVTQEKVLPIMRSLQSPEKTFARVDDVMDSIANPLSLFLNSTYIDSGTLSGQSMLKFQSSLDNAFLNSVVKNAYKNNNQLIVGTSIEHIQFKKAVATIFIDAQTKRVRLIDMVIELALTVKDQNKESVFSGSLRSIRIYENQDGSVIVPQNIQIKKGDTQLLYGSKYVQ